MHIHPIDVICNSCNMGVRDLPDMYAQSPRAGEGNTAVSEVVTTQRFKRKSRDLGHMT